MKKKKHFYEKSTTNTFPGKKNHSEKKHKKNTFVYLKTKKAGRTDCQCIAFYVFWAAQFFNNFPNFAGFKHWNNF